MAQTPSYDELKEQLNAFRLENETLRKNAAAIEASEAFHRITLENISDAVIITDDYGNIIYACPNANVIFGLSQRRIYDKASIQKLIDGDVCDLSELKKAGEIPNIEWKLKNNSGQERVVLITAKSVSIKEGTVLYVMRDITEKKAKEKEVIEKQDELKKYAQKLEEMNTALKVLIEYRKEELDDVKRSIIGKFKKIVIPYFPMSPETKTHEELLTTMSILESNVKEILFGNQNHAEEYSDLSPTESRLAFMIKSGKSSKGIAASLNIGLRTVYFHRENLRKKLNLSRTKTNLNAYLQSSNT